MIAKIKNRKQDFFDDLCDYMLKGPVVSLELEAEDAVIKWRELMSPKATEGSKRAGKYICDPVEAMKENDEQLAKLLLKDPEAKKTYKHCLRALYGDRRDHPDAFWRRGCRRNAVHGADSDKAAEREIKVFKDYLGDEWTLQCRECNGAGTSDGSQCDACDGTGEEASSEKRRRLAPEFSFPDCSDCTGTGRIGFFFAFHCHPCFGTGKTRD